MAITPRDIAGLSYKEITKMIGYSISTVRSRIFRAREAIAVRLRLFLEIFIRKRW
ncbi:sigma factor-like helix-turn-helix DNA-binding protein [Candidatus Vallotiella sp. (ex Adelges kitamiensis)]|uniref:sigma factor-like helix-turn-helix DNA-binding protein n=1 Tax=Candidatus Vallotiella sp. (ex Adelges kitamiensis) TaxID=2864217 RepID=UPI001CE2C39B|nr:sigma factor-like helix-turn-helix DNA-binding protein [Candidatus Vallotia sp. (ex Adelges kitamiensis)]